MSYVFYDLITCYHASTNQVASTTLCIHSNSIQIKTKTNIIISVFLACFYHFFNVGKFYKLHGGMELLTQILSLTPLPWLYLCCSHNPVFLMSRYNDFLLWLVRPWNRNFGLSYRTISLPRCQMELCCVIWSIIWGKERSKWYMCPALVW